MNAAKAIAQVPRPTPPRDLSAAVTIRLLPAAREAIKALADQEGVSVQQLGVYALNLVMAAYGKPPLPIGD